MPEPQPAFLRMFRRPIEDSLRFAVRGLLAGLLVALLDLLFFGHALIEQFPSRLLQLRLVGHVAATSMVALLPLGVLQLYHSVNSGYFEARSLGYITNPSNVLLEWMRMPGDLVFIIGGILPFLYIAYVAVRHFFKSEPTEQFTENPLFEVLPSDGKVATKVGAGGTAGATISGAATADTGSDADSS